MTADATSLTYGACDLDTQSSEEIALFLPVALHSPTSGGTTCLLTVSTADIRLYVRPAKNGT